MNAQTGNQSAIWQTSTGTFWRDSVTGQVFDLQPDEEYPELPADAVRLVPTPSATPLPPFVLGPVTREADTTFQNDEDGDPIPGTLSIGWDMSWGCRLNFGQCNGDLLFTLSISDMAQKRGIEQKTVTADQLRDFANKLISIANLNDHIPSALGVES